MAEILATMVVGPLVSMLKEKASSYLLEQYNVMEGMEEQHKTLKRKLPAIMDVIADAENQAAQHREGAKAWLEEVRNVAYLGNDVFDEFKYEALRRKAKKEGHYHKLGMHVFKLFPTHNRIVFRYRMGNKLRFILQQIEVLIAEMNAFRFEFRPQQQFSMKWRQTDPNIQDPMEIAGRSRAEEKKKFVETLLGQESNVDLTVVPIFGMGGLGKTTLAQLVFKDTEIGKHFQLLLWVCVSDNFDVDFLAKTIVEKAAPGTVSSDKPPLDRLREVVSGKRYLLVLDDVWNRDVSKWEKLKGSLQHGGMGSCVLTTTRDKAIAEFMGKAKAYKLGFLDKGFIEEIIKTKASTSEKEIPAEKLVEMVGAMADKCSGSPLAATALGYVLHTKHSVEEWEAISKRSTICDEETGILPILKLSYNVLPSQMRQCFSFCAMFPKDYEMDVEMLIRLWIANGFILEEKGVCPEIRGKQIFTELLSRSFFQDVKETPIDENRSRYGYCSRMTCKIHDLMHDVAQSAMGKECATIATEPGESDDFAYSTRHLFVPYGYQETVLEGFVEKSSLDLQTLFCTRECALGELQFLSRYNSIRALRIKGGSSLSLKPKHLHHLRYLDLSGSYCIESLPEDVSILYHLQTLDLSGCYNLVQLPKQMKYMTALRHLYTHGCEKLKKMPPELSCLTSLRTLTRFVAGTTGSSCSNLGELELLDLGDQLEVHQLENVTETEARAANLGNKKRLTELVFAWTRAPNREPQDHQHEGVLGGLKPHDGIKVLRIFSYGGSTCPTWMNTLQHLVELEMSGCSEIDKLPELWQLPALQVLHMSGMSNLRCLCGGDPPFTFKKLKKLRLYDMANFEAWWDINEMQELDGPVFPEVERLSIENCQRLTALPRASVIRESSGGVVNPMWRSAFPALKELGLSNLTNFQRWEEVAGTLGEQITTFPCLEDLFIEDCPELTTLPEAPRLSVLDIREGSQQICLRAARYITLLSKLVLGVHKREAELLAVDDKEKWNLESSSSLRVIELQRCDFSLTHSSAPTLWNCFVQLEDLTIRDLNALVHWPENVFRRLTSLRELEINWCKKLTGRSTQQEASSEQSATSCVLPPRLESLKFWSCESLVEVPTLPASLRSLTLWSCEKLESVVVRKQEKSCSEPMPLPNLSLSIFRCDNLRSLSVPLDCTDLDIQCCGSLESLDYGDKLRSLERLILDNCDSLESIPDVPQAYSSLRELVIYSCPHLEVLPPCLKQRLNDIEYKALDARHTDASRPWTWKRAMGVNTRKKLKA